MLAFESTGRRRTAGTTESRAKSQRGLQHWGDEFGVEGPSTWCLKLPWIKCALQGNEPEWSSFWRAELPNLSSS